MYNLLGSSARLQISWMSTILPPALLALEMILNKLKIPFRHIVAGVLHSTVYFLLTFVY